MNKLTSFARLLSALLVASGGVTQAGTIAPPSATAVGDVQHHTKVGSTLDAFVLRKDLDEPGYTIVVPKGREQAFNLAFEKAAGKDCLRLVIDRSGCHYNSKHGHGVFVERTSLLTYSIYTSG
jgi:hypothetical protein